MDINDVRGILTAIIFFAFIGIWVWAWSSRRKKDFDGFRGFAAGRRQPHYF